MTKNRLARVSEVLRREISAAVRREIQFSAALVTIHEVDITPDLRQAHVFVSVMGAPAQQQDVMRSLEEARPALQALVARRVVLKHTPHFHFHLDASIERGSRVLSIMTELGMDIAPDPVPSAPLPPESRPSTAE